MTDRFVAELLKWGVATEEQVAAARRLHESSGGLLPTHLIKSGVRSVDVLSALWAQTGIPIAPASMMRDAERAKSTWSVEPRAAWRCLAVPIGLHEGALRIAYADPAMAAHGDKADLPPHKPMLAEEARVRELLLAVFGPMPTTVPSTLPSSLEEALAAARSDSGTFEMPAAAKDSATTVAAAPGPGAIAAPSWDAPSTNGVSLDAPASAAPASAAPATTAPATTAPAEAAPGQTPALAARQPSGPARPAPRFPLDDNTATRPSPRLLTAVHSRAAPEASRAWVLWLLAALVIGGAFIAVARSEGIFGGTPRHSQNDDVEDPAPTKR